MRPEVVRNVSNLTCFDNNKLPPHTYMTAEYEVYEYKV